MSYKGTSHDHCYSTIYGRSTTENDCPFLIQRRKIKALTNSPSEQHAHNTGVLVHCDECDKWPVHHWFGVQMFLKTLCPRMLSCPRLVHTPCCSCRIASSHSTCASPKHGAVPRSSLVNHQIKNPPIVLFVLVSHNPPNLIPAKFSSYMVCTGVLKLRLMPMYPAIN